jgi:hypothetical protein
VCAQFSVPKFFCHSFINCGLRHFGSDKTQLSYRYMSICANLSFNFLKVIRDQRWITTPLSVVNISSSIGQFTAPPRHILPIQNVTLNSNSLFCEFPLDLQFALRNRMTERILHLAGLWSSAVISNTSRSNKASSTIVKRARITGKGSESTAVFPQ